MDNVIPVNFGNEGAPESPEGQKEDNGAMAEVHELKIKPTRSGLSGGTRVDAAARMVVEVENAEREKQISNTEETREKRAQASVRLAGLINEMPPQEQEEAYRRARKLVDEEIDAAQG